MCSSSPSNLQIGDKVIFYSLNMPRAGTLKFIGETEFAKGQWAGIDLDEPTGKNDGSIAGTRYFKCQKKHGLFIKLSRVSKADISKPGRVKATPLMRSNSRDSLISSLSELQKSPLDTSSQNDVVAHLNTTIQEKDDMILNLKNELNSFIEKVTQLTEDNRNLTEQMLLKEEQAKGHADDVIKELGEKINLLNEELKTKSSQLVENISSTQEKDSKISTLELNLNDQSAALLQLQNEHKNINDVLKHKELELEEKVAVQKSLEETIVALKSQLQSFSGETEKKMLDLVKEIENLTNCVQEKDDQLLKAQSELAAMKSENEELKETIQQLSEKVQQVELSLTETSKGDSEKISSLQNELSSIRDEKESLTSAYEKKINLLNEELKTKSSQLVENISSTQEKDSKISTLELNLNDQSAALLQLQNEHKNINDVLKHKELELEEKVAVQKSLEETIVALKSQLQSFSGETEKKMLDLVKEIENLTNCVQEKDDQLLKAQSELAAMKSENEELKETIQQLSEKVQQVELSLTETSKGDSEKISSLQNELSSIRDEKESLTSAYEKKINLLNEELKTKSSQLVENISSTQEKDSKISTLELNLNDQSAALLQLQNEHKNINDVLKHKELELEEKVAVQKSLEETIVALKSQLQSFSGETEKKMLDLVKEIENLTNCVQEKDDQLLKAQSELAAMKSENEELKETIQQLSEKVQQVELSLTETSKGDSEKISSLQNELSSIRDEKESLTSAYEKKINLLNEELKTKSSQLVENISSTQEKDSKISTLELNLNDQSAALLQLQNEHKNINDVLKHKELELEEKVAVQKSLKETIVALKSQLQSFSGETEKKMLDLVKEIENLTNCVQEKDDQLLKAQSELAAMKSENEELKETIQQLSEKVQQVELSLTETSKGDSEKISSLQNELSSIRDEKESLTSAYEKAAKKFLLDIIKRVHGLYAIIITDRDGIPVVKGNIAETPDVVCKPNFLASVSLAVEEAGKFGCGKMRRIICMFDSFQVLHFNKTPLMTTLVASAKANTGLLLNLEKELNEFVEDLRTGLNHEEAVEEPPRDVESL